MKIAVLITCFNRKSKTIRCLKSLFDTNFGFEVYLVDDGSTDGTTEAIKRTFPNVNIIQGTGNLFWSRGMSLAWKQASNTKNDDFYLWLNDDVCLYEFCLKELLECSLIYKDLAIITGIIESEDKSRILYGGYDINKKMIVPDGTIQSVRNLNGNVVLIPRLVYLKLGNFDLTFHHDLGDLDYGFQAIKKNITVLTTRLPIAFGTYNSISRLRLNNSTIYERFKRLYSPLGNPPLINFYFRKKHYGFFNATIYWLYLHFLNIISDKINSFLFKNKYS